MSYLGENIRRIRKDKGLSIAKLASLSKASPASISQIENGKRDATFKLILNIARGLNIEVGELVTPLDEKYYEHDINLAIKFSNNEGLIMGKSSGSDGHQIFWIGVFMLNDDIELLELLHVIHNKNVELDFEFFCNKSLFPYLNQQRLRILLWRCVMLDKSYEEIKTEGVDWLSLKNLIIHLFNTD